MRNRHLFSAVAVLLNLSCADGAQGPAGAAAQPEAPAPTSLNQVSPRMGLLGRTHHVRLTFDGIALPDGAKVTFGDGIKVTKITADNGGLACDIVVAEDTPVGPRDVTVTVPDLDPIVAKKGFVVAAPLDLKVAAGKAEQGGLVQVDVANNDKVPFDTQNFALYAVAGQSDGTLVQLNASGITETDASIVLLGDPLAKTGTLGFLGLNDPQDPETPTFLSPPDAVTVTARTPDALTSGTPVDKTLANPLETAFFTASFTPQAGEGLLLDAHAVTPTGSTITPTVLGYPASGRAADLLDQKKDDPGFALFGIPPSEARVAYPVTAAGKAFFVVFDSSMKNGPDTKLHFDFNAYRAALVDEVATAHDTDAPQTLPTLPTLAVAVPGQIVNGAIKAAGEKDVYQYTGLSGSAVTDLQISLATTADLSVLVDTVSTFDSPNLVTVSKGGQVGSGSTTGFVGATRFIQVVAADGASVNTGSYTLGLRRAN